MEPTFEKRIIADGLGKLILERLYRCGPYTEWRKIAHKPDPAIYKDVPRNVRWERSPL